MVTHAQAEAFLVERFGAGVRAVCSVGHGEWSQAFTYARGGEAGGQYVVRFSPFEEDFAKDRLAAGYGSPALPIPPIVEVREVREVTEPKPLAQGDQVVNRQRHAVAAG